MASNEVRVFEVGPRDGLQNEKREISKDQKLRFVQDLIDAGIRDLELGAFVRPDKVPQMKDTDWIFSQIRSRAFRLGKAKAWSLVPNIKGLRRALATGAKNLAVFTAATESFAKANIGMSIDESLAEFSEITQTAKRMKIEVRGYVSTAFGCPFEGKVPPKQALKVIEKLGKLGVTEVSVGDTIGVATPKDIEAVMKPALKMLGATRVAGHYHDTRGTALANTLRSLDLGVRTFDSSAGGLGGCPFAPGASGNLATEDLVYMLEGMGMKTGIDLEKLCRASLKLNEIMKRPIASRYLQAFVAKCEASK